MILLLLTLGGSAVPRSSALAPLWQVPFAEGEALLRVTGTSVYVLGLEHAGRFSAYDLRTGVQRWSGPGGSGGGWLPVAADGVVLLSSRATVAFSDRTGARIWSRPGQVLAGSGRNGHALLVDWDDALGTVGGARLVALRNGAVRWSATPAGRWIDVAADTAAPDRLVTVAADGLVEVRRLDDGRVVASARQPWDTDGRMTVERHGIYLTSITRTGLTLFAYDTETLRPRWSRPVRDYGAATGCGPVLCLITPAGVTGLDRDTGEPRWDRPAAGNPVTVGTDRIVLDADPSGVGHTLIDAARGTTVAELGGAAPIPGEGDGTYLLDRGAVVAELTPGTGERQMRGLVEGVSAYGCQVAGHTLICNTHPGRLTAIDLGPVGAPGG